MTPFGTHLRSLTNRSHATNVFVRPTLFPPLGRDDPALPHPSINPPARRKEEPAPDRSAVLRTPVGNGGGVKHGPSCPPAPPVG